MANLSNWVWELKHRDFVHALRGGNIEARRIAILNMKRAIDEKRDMKEIEPGIPTLERSLYDIDPLNFIYLIDLLEAIGEPAFPTLLRAFKNRQALKDPNKVVEALGRLGKRDAVMALLEALKEEKLTHACAVALRRIDEPAAALLLVTCYYNLYASIDPETLDGAIGKEREALLTRARNSNSKTANRRISLIHALATLDDPDVLTLLIEALGDVYNPDVCICAADALWYKKNPLAIPSLMKLLRQETVFAQLGSDLSFIVPPSNVAEYGEYVKANDAKLREKVEEALVMIGKESAPALQETLTDRSVFVRVSAAAVLCKIGNYPDAEQVLNSALATSEDPVVRRKAMIALDRVCRRHNQ